MTEYLRQSQRYEKKNYETKRCSVIYDLLGISLELQNSVNQ